MITSRPLKRDKKERTDRKPYKRNSFSDKKINPEELAGMSYEERMKLYKEKYGSKKSNSERSFEGKNSKKAGYSKSSPSNKSYKKNGYKKNYNKAAAVQKKPEPKKGLWSKIKALFGKK